MNVTFAIYVSWIDKDYLSVKIKYSFFTTETECVYSALRAESFNIFQINLRL